MAPCAPAWTVIALVAFVVAWQLFDQVSHLHGLDEGGAGESKASDGSASGRAVLPGSAAAAIADEVSHFRVQNKVLRDRLIKTGEIGRRAAHEIEVSLFRAQNEELRGRLIRSGPFGQKAVDEIKARIGSSFDDNASARVQSIESGQAVSQRLEQGAAFPPASGIGASIFSAYTALSSEPSSSTPSCPTDVAELSVLEPMGAESHDVVVSAHWPLSSMGASTKDGSGAGSSQLVIGGKLGELRLPESGRLRLRLHGHGVARLVLESDSGPQKGYQHDKAEAGLEVLLNGTPLLVLRSSQHGATFLAYTSGDLLELVTKVPFKVKSFEVLWQDCEATLNANEDTECTTWQRVRLPWTSCQDETEASSSAQKPNGWARAGLRSLFRKNSEVVGPSWIEGRVSRVINRTHAIVQIPSPSQCFTEKFDPTSPLVSYVDEGECGPRGNDAEVDASSCQFGVELVRSVAMDNYKIQASYGSCNFFSYSIFRCIGSDGNGKLADMGMVEVGASMLAPLEEEVPFGFREASKDIALAGKRRRCHSFRYEPDKKIAIVLIGDTRFQAKYRTQIQSLQCFADRHGYDLKKLTGSEHAVCRKFHDYFFKKHCTVAEWLESQSPNLVAAIVDADVVAAVPYRGLERWAFHPSDVQVYQRCLLAEIMAGNYMVRNTPYARAFLRKWANYNFEMPRGYSSSDNGAIHLVVQEVVQSQGFPKCKQMYKSLTSDVMDLSQYFNFTQCVIDDLGPPRDWHSNGGVVTVWPRFNFWAADGVYMNMNGGRGIGPILHHGIKDRKDVVEHYYLNVDKCQLNNGKVMRSDREIGQAVLGIARAYKEYFPQGNPCRGTAPRQCPESCISTVNCWPLGDQEPPLPKRTCTSCA